MKIGDLEKKMYIKLYNFAIQRTVSLKWKPHMPCVIGKHVYLTT